MKKITWSKVKTIVKGWRLGDFVRQVAVVVIGVVITFMGSDLITQNSERKDIRSTLSLIHI